MPSLRVIDILNRAIEFHQMLVDFYARLEEVSEKENVLLLVDYMARHEKVLKEHLSQLTSEQLSQIAQSI